MIHSSIANEGMTRLLEANPALRAALDWLRHVTADAADGITQLQGADLYVNVHGYRTKPRGQCTWESHRHTADVQFCIAGGECIDWLERPGLAGGSSYDPERDFETWTAPAETWQTAFLRPGEYVIFLPGELHRPMISDGSHESIRKVVAKVQADLLNAAAGRAGPR